MPCGLIHDWLGAIFFPNARLDDVMSVLDDYERYPDFYGPMVAKARRTQQAPGHEKVVMVMAHKAYSVTGAVETDNEVTIVRLDAKRAYSLSASVRVREIADYRQPGERTLTEDHGPGFVWRTFSVTRLEQRDDGVYVEMEMAGDEPQHPGVVQVAGPSRWQNACPEASWRQRLRTPGTP